MKRLIALLLVVVLALGMLAGCGQPAADDQATPTPDATPTPAAEGGDDANSGEPTIGGDLVVGTFADPDTLNPVVGNDMAGSWILSLLYPTLYKLDEAGNKVPYIMEEPVWAEDGMSVDVKLIEGLTWDDGVPLTTADVAYSCQILVDTQAQWQYTMLDGVTWECHDDYNMTFYLSSPYPAFLTGMGFWTMIVPAHVWGEMSNEEVMEFANEEPVGIGPFKLTSYERGQYYIVEARDFPLADAGRPYIDSITFRVYADTNTMALALKAGDIDMNVKELPETSAQEFAQDPNFTVVHNESLGFEHICPNLKNELLADVNVRKALAMCMDREQIAAFAFDGAATPMYAPVSPVYTEYQYDDIRHSSLDIEGAKAALAEAGWTDTDGDGYVDKDGQKLSLELMYAVTVTAYSKVAQIIIANAKEAGIEIIDAPMDKALTSERLYDPTNTEWQLSLGTWGILDDIAATMYTLYGETSNLNFGGWVNDEANEVMEEMQKTLDPTILEGYMRTLQSIMIDEVVDIPLVVCQCSYAYNGDFSGQTVYPSNLKGVIDVQAMMDIYQTP